MVNFGEIYVFFIIGGAIFLLLNGALSLIRGGGEGELPLPNF